MARKKIDMLWLIVSIGGFALMSTSFVLMPLDKTVEIYDSMDIIPGIMFWAFLMLGVVGQVLLTIRRKRFLETNRSDSGLRKERIGLISVFKNVPAIIADVGFVISLVAFVLAINVTNGIGFICYILLAICVFTFCLHCILNGKNFFYVVKQEEYLLNKREENGNGKD